MEDRISGKVEVKNGKILVKGFANEKKKELIQLNMKTDGINWCQKVMELKRNIKVGKRKGGRIK